MTNTEWLQVGIVLLIISMFFYVLRSVVSAKPLIREIAWGVFALSTASLLISLWVRSTEAQYFALSNMYESMLVLVIGVQLGFLVMDRWFRIPSLGWPVCLLLVIALAYDTTLPTDIQPLQAALQSYWRSIHVPVIILSYAMFTIAFLSSLVYLGKSYYSQWRENKNSGSGSSGGIGSGGGRQQLLPADGPVNRETGLAALYEEAKASVEKDSDAIYDEITYRAVSFGFPLLLIGIILGGLWANEAWGNYWSWDPKESMSLVTLLGYGVYLHLRVNGEHSPRTLAYVSIAGYILMLVTYFGVNLMGLGLHSYGKIG